MEKVKKRKIKPESYYLSVLNKQNIDEDKKKEEERKFLNPKNRGGIMNVRTH